MVKNSNAIEILFNRLGEGGIITYLLFVFSLIIPGLGIVYLTDFSLFKEIHFIKLIMLTIFFSLPLFILSFFSVMLFFGRDIEDKKFKLYALTNMISLFSLISFFTAILFMILFSLIVNRNISLSNLKYILWFVYGTGVIANFISVPIVKFLTNKFGL